MEPVGGASLANRARGAILHSILERRFEHSRLPPENELADMLGVSRTTVRSALQSLEQHGVLTRSPRRGTNVHGRMSASMVALQRLVGFTRMLDEQGYKVEMTTKLAKTTAPPPEATAASAIRPDAPCYKIDRMIIASGHPAIWAIDYFPTDTLKVPLRRDHLAHSPFEMGDLLVGGPIDHALVALVPRNASKEVVEHIALTPSEAYLMLQEIHLSDSGTVLGFSLIHVNDHFVRFQLHRGADGL